MTACVFCGIARGDLAAHVVLEDARFVALLDRKPLFHGHVLVVPRAHVVTLPELDEGDVAPLFAIVRRLSRAVPEAMDAEGSFVAMNNVVSQSVPHLHVHVVPRRKGDGLKGFFWPRHAYATDDDMAAVAGRIRAALGPA